MIENDCKTLLNTFINAPGISGFENPIYKIIQEKWAPWVDETNRTPLGSLHGIKYGARPIPRRKILLAAHMDAIGLMVTRIENGFIFFTAIGGIDPRILPGQLVTVFGRKEIPGIIALPSDHLLPHENQNGPIPLECLIIDTGLRNKDVESYIQIGDPVSFANPPIALGKELVSGHSLDNRASITAITLCLQELAHMDHSWDVITAATTLEEETMGGGITSSFKETPTLAVAVDVTFARSLGLDDYNTFPLGKGIALGFGPNIHPYLFKDMKALCENLDIPFHTDIMPGHSGTDAYAMQISADGIPTMVLSIPLRYMHTPVETVNIKDISRAGHLLAEWIARLDDRFLNQLSWDE